MDGCVVTELLIDIYVCFETETFFLFVRKVLVCNNKQLYTLVHVVAVILKYILFLKNISILKSPVPVN
jgi:hypothetical protein